MTDSITYTNEQGQTVTAVPGQPGTVTTGRPQRVEIAAFDVFATIPGAYPKCPMTGRDDCNGADSSQCSAC